MFHKQIKYAYKVIVIFNEENEKLYMNDIHLRNMMCVYLINREKLLLLYRIGSRLIKDNYTGTAGGHFNKDELNAPRTCVLREPIPNSRT